MPRRFVIASAVLVAALAIGFVGGWFAHQPSTARTGTISGHLLAVGGPCCLGPRPLSGTVYVSTGSPTKAAITVQVRSDGTYSVAVPPGTYTLIGASPSYLGGRRACYAEGRVTVTSGGHVAADTFCHER